MSTLESGDLLLLESLEAALREAARRAGRWLACRPGCTECCIGPFPITELDAWRLRRGHAQLAEDDPDRAARILARAWQAAQAMSHEFPGEPNSGSLSGDFEAEERFFQRYEALPCPLLDPETGLCELYAARPISCRTFGPPVRIGMENLPPCRLCFAGADPETVEACRVQVDPEDLEQTLLDATGRARTVIALALLRPGAPVPLPRSSPGISPACWDSPRRATAWGPSNSPETDGPLARSGLHDPHDADPGS